MKLGLIVNPKAGGGLDKNKLKLIVSVLKKLNPDIVTLRQNLLKFRLR